MLPEPPHHHSDLVDELVGDALARLDAAAGTAARALMAGVADPSTRTALASVVSGVERAAVEIRQASGRAAA